MNQMTQMSDDMGKNQKAFDDLIMEKDKRKVGEKSDFLTAWKDLTNEHIFSKKQEDVVKMVNDDKFKLSIDLKVANMLSSTNITGDVVSTYNTRVGMVPDQKINFRDLIRTVNSPTGQFVTYRETGTSGSISVQTEGVSKTQIDYSFTELKAVSKYIAGFAVFSKQFMYNLPFLQQQLVFALLRDFYKKENDYIYDTMVAAATGSSATSATSTNDAEEMIDWIANQRTANFNASRIIIDHSEWAHLMKTGRNANSSYGVPGSVQFDNNGGILFAGIPVTPASWADPGEFLLYDSEYVERIETESLRVEFSFEDNDNFRKNLITARVECFEELNVVRTDAIIHGEYGGS